MCTLQVSNCRHGCLQVIRADKRVQAFYAALPDLRRQSSGRCLPNPTLIPVMHTAHRCAPVCTSGMVHRPRGSHAHEQQSATALLS